VAYAVYVIRSESTGQIYIGQTANLDNRLRQHNDPDFGGTLHTKRRAGPWRVVHSEVFATRAQAVGRERYLKSAAGRRWIRRSVLVDEVGETR